MAEKLTTMVLKVDLQCSCCYKKIKKILCKFPQIRDQVYDEKGNTVTVTVACCSPEKCRDKLCSKGGKVIKSIEIKEAAKTTDIPKVKDAKTTDIPKVKEAEKKKEAGKPKEPEKPKVIVVEKPKEPEKPKVVVVEPEKSKPQDNKPKTKAPESAAKPPPSEPVKLPVANPVNGIPPVFPPMACYGPSYNGFGGGAPWYNGYGIPPLPQPKYDGYYGYEYGYPYGGGRCDAYFSEENPSVCSIM